MTDEKNEKNKFDEKSRRSEQSDRFEHNESVGVGASHSQKTQEDHYQKLSADRVHDSKAKMRKLQIEQTTGRPGDSLSGGDGHKIAKRSRIEEYRRTAKEMKDGIGGSKAMMPFNAAKIGFRLRKEIRDGNSAAWEIAYVFAIVIDFADIIPLAGFIIDLFFSFPLFIMLWGYGKWKMKVFRAVLLFFNMIPGIGFFPLAIISVAYSHHVAKKRARKAEKELKQLQKVIKKRMRKEGKGLKQFQKVAESV